MTIQASSILEAAGAPTRVWATALNSSSSTALESKGIIRWDRHPQYGFRGFQYCRIDQSGGMTAGQLSSYRVNVAVNNIAESGTTHATTRIETSGLTADIHIDSFLNCLDDVGGAGAAPEGETGRIIANTATVITIDSDDAFSATPADNDDFVIITPWAVNDSANGDFSGTVAGVIMAAQDQYDYGWVQFFGIHPTVAAVAAGTTIPDLENVVAFTATVNDSNGDDADLAVGKAMHQLSTDTVLRTIMVDLRCGQANKILDGG